MDDFAADWLGRLQPYFVEYGVGFILVVLFLKNLLFLGPIMPGALVLVAAGGLARQGQGSLSLMALAALAGTVAGTSASYFIGQKAGDRLLQSKRWGKVVAAVSERVRKEPTLLIFCHFETVLRMFVPATAGMSGVPFLRWFLLNLSGATLWVALYIAAGYFFSIAGAMALGKTIGVVVLALLIVIVATHYLPERFVPWRGQLGKWRRR